MKIIYSFVLLSIFCINGCGDNVETIDMSFEPTDLQIVTGVNYYDINGSLISKTGNPNTKSSDALVLYPNPNDGRLTVQNLEAVGFTVWLTRAEKNLNFSTVEYKSLNFNYTDELLESEKVLKGNTDLNSIQLDISLLGYRLHTTIKGFCKQRGNLDIYRTLF